MRNGGEVSQQGPEGKHGGMYSACVRSLGLRCIREASTPHLHTGLKGHLPPSLELEPDRILMERRRGTEPNQDLCFHGTSVSCGSFPSGERIPVLNRRVVTSPGWAMSIPKSQHREQSSHQMSCHTKIIRHKVK